MRQRGRSVFSIIVLCVSLLALPGCGGGSGSSSESTATLVLAAYTTPREAYGKAIIPAFQKYWKATTGQNVVIRQSYQGSGAQSRAVIGGFEADVVALSLAQDVDRIAQAGLITHDWKAKAHKGMVSTSIVVIAVRPGNPKGIRDWSDLASPGLKILTPDPRTSGGAMWNVCAMYGAALRGHAGLPEGRASGEKFLKSVFQNVSIMDKGARESITNFEKGVGDAALTYENEVLVGRDAGQKYEYVIPTSTILIENPVAVVDKHVDKHGVRKVAEAFVEFLTTLESQRSFSKYGLRPLNNEAAQEARDRYPEVKDLWRIDFLGGWERVVPEIFGPNGVYTRISKESRSS